MKKSLYVCLISVVCLVLFSCKMEPEVSQDGLLFRALSDGTYMVEGIETGSVDHLVIPSKVKGKPVSVIAKYGFQNWDIKTVSIPDSITMIGDYAFQGCKSLTEIDIPSSVTVIGTRAFNECNKLTKVTLHDGLKTIGNSAFYNTGNIEKLVVPDSVEIIKDCGLYTYIKALYVPKGVKEVGKMGFLSYIGTDYPIAIYCEASEKPSGWDAAFAADNYGKANLSTVIWGHSK